MLTHCNAGHLACVGYGTALGVIRAAHETGKAPTVWADETRPVLQGARLTAWELDQLGIPVTVIPDVLAGSLLAGGEVDAVVVGADRIAANGDTCNKVGTYPLAVLARRHEVPVLRGRTDLDDRPRLPRRGRDRGRAARAATRSRGWARPGSPPRGWRWRTGRST